MNGTRILVACELQSYRQAFAATFRELCPDVEVFEAEEQDLDREVERLGPDLVVCSRLTARVEDHAPSWNDSILTARLTRWSAFWESARPSRRYSSPIRSQL